LAGVVVAAVLATCAWTVQAEDTLKVAAGQRGNWDTSISEVGQRAGIFKKHGIVLEMLGTPGGG
jgi:NitT/TauT family transport system substrate-binding protein